MKSKKLTVANLALIHRRTVNKPSPTKPSQQRGTGSCKAVSKKAPPVTSGGPAMGKSSPPMMTITFSGKVLERICEKVCGACYCKKCQKTYPAWMRKFWETGEL